MDSTYIEEEKNEKAKFKVGDRIVFNGGGIPYTIKEVHAYDHYINTDNKRMDMAYTDANFKIVIDNLEEIDHKHLVHKKECPSDKVGDYKPPLSSLLSKEKNEFDDFKTELEHYLSDGLPNEEELAEYIKDTARHFAKWQREQLAKDNMFLPFKEYDNLMDSINKRKKEGYEDGFTQGLLDATEKLWNMWRLLYKESVQKRVRHYIR